MINFTYQIHFVTNDGFILGSALAQENELIGEQTPHRNANAYLLNVPINEITGPDNPKSLTTVSDPRKVGTVILTADIAANGEATIRNQYDIPTVEYVSWAIVDSAGHFILGKNGAFEPFSIYTRHKFEQEED